MALTGAWRRVPAPLTLEPAAFAQVTPLLLTAGAGALGWWRARGSDLASTPAAAELRQAYRFHTLHAALHEREIVEAVSLLRAAGVEPLLVKGWAAAQLYPEPGLRPYGDLDLCVRPEQHDAARAALRSFPALAGAIDLHAEFSPQHVGYSLLDDRPLSDLYDHSRLAPLGDVTIRVLGPEDHLRLLCLHMLGHGASRALWLCDIAAALENRPPDFDWERCLGSNRRRSDWVACALCLAHQLLGASIEDTPIAVRARHLPRWLVPAVLRQWERGDAWRGEIVHCLHQPLTALRELRRHWRNPIEATIEIRGAFNDWPRLTFQMGAAILRAAQLLSDRTARKRQPV